VGGRRQTIQRVGCELAAGHEVDKFVERDTSRLANLFIRLPCCRHRMPQPTADGVFRRGQVSGLPPFEKPRQLSPHGGFYFVIGSEGITRAPHRQ